MEQYHEILVSYSDYLTAKQEGNMLSDEQFLSKIEALKSENKNVKTLIEYLDREKSVEMREKMITLNTKKPIERVSIPTVPTQSVEQPTPVTPEPIIQEVVPMPIPEIAVQPMVEEPVMNQAKPKIFQKTKPTNRIAGFIDALTLAWISGMVGGALFTIMLVIIS